VSYRRAASLALSPPSGCRYWLPDAAVQSSRVREIPLSATHRHPSPNRNPAGGHTRTSLPLKTPISMQERSKIICNFVSV